MYVFYSKTKLQNKFVIFFQKLTLVIIFKNILKKKTWIFLKIKHDIQNVLKYINYLL